MMSKSRFRRYGPTGEWLYILHLWKKHFWDIILQNLTYSAPLHTLILENTCASALAWSFFHSTKTFFHRFWVGKISICILFNVCLIYLCYLIQILLSFWMYFNQKHLIQFYHKLWGKMPSWHFWKSTMNLWIKVYRLIIKYVCCWETKIKFYGALQGFEW